jgi:NADPH-dependent glutamate synthase beta subunit-like oxidoreductase/ferredoxin
MPKLKIDQRDVEVPPGTSVLEAARRLGIDIPTLCFLEGYPPATSCLVCMVKLSGNHRLVPSCGTEATDGMEVESETAEVHQVRRSALELLLSDHLGDCLAPCYFGCPAQMDIPRMLRQIAAGDLRGAIVTVKNDIALPAVLGCICPAPCEKVCRRGAADAAVAICLLKRLAADADLASGDPYRPPCRPATGKRVAIVGAGPTGLAAAYYLAQRGHACTISDENEQPGGRLRRETSAEQLPPEVLDAEIQTILRLGIEVRYGTRIGPEQSLRELREKFDAVLIACGAAAGQQAHGWGLKTSHRGIEVLPGTYETSVGGVFAAGNAIRAKGIVVRSVADGKEAAVAIDQYLMGQAVTGPPEQFSTKIGRMEADELQPLLGLSSPSARQEPVERKGVGCLSPEGLEGRDARKTPDPFSGGYTPQEGAAQAARCLHCDCRGLQSCKLRKYAALYGAQPRRYKAGRRVFQQDGQHAEVLFEPGKCIDCGLCIQIAAAAREPLGLTFVGRGFDVRVGVPLSRSLAEALRQVAAQCVAACPTAALAWKDEPRL